MCRLKLKPDTKDSIPCVWFGSSAFDFSNYRWPITNSTYVMKIYFSACFSGTKKTDLQRGFVWIKRRNAMIDLWTDFSSSLHSYPRLAGGPIESVSDPKIQSCICLNQQLAAMEKTLSPEQFSRGDSGWMNIDSEVCFLCEDTRLLRRCFICPAPVAAGFFIGMKGVTQAADN